MTPLLADVLFYTTVALYTGATALFFAHLAGTTRFGAERGARVFVAAAVGCHAAHVVVASLVLHVCPVEGMHFALNIVSLLAGAAYLGLRARYRLDVLGAVIAPFALTFLVGSRIVSAKSEPLPEFRGAITFLHVAVNLVGDALFALAFAAAVTYLLQESRLKQKRLVGLFQRLPPLDALDRAEHGFLLAGFPLLTIGVLTGTLWARRLERADFVGGAFALRTAFAWATWFMFAAVLLLRAAAGWRGRRAAYGTIAGFSVALIVLVLYLVRSRGVEGLAELGRSALAEGG